MKEYMAAEKMPHEQKKTPTKRPIQISKELHSLIALLANDKRYDEELDGLGNFEAEEIRQFCKYAFKFIGNLVRNILNLPSKEMQLCKQLLFPDGFYVDENKNVYTTKISLIYRLKGIKKDSDESSGSLVVAKRRDSNSRSVRTRVSQQNKASWSLNAWCERRDSNSRPLPWQGSALNN